MGYLDKSTQTVTAHFTKRGRELLADALAGNTSGDYIITQFALGDDEVDYSLYDESLSPNLRGKVIENILAALITHFGSLIRSKIFHFQYGTFNFFWRFR